MTVEINEAGMAAFLAGTDLRNFTLAAAEIVAREARSRIETVTGGRMAAMKIDPEAIVGVRVNETATGPEAEVGLTESDQTGADMLLKKAEDEKGTEKAGNWAEGSAKLLEPFGWVVE